MRFDDTLNFGSIELQPNVYTVELQVVSDPATTHVHVQCGTLKLVGPNFTMMSFVGSMYCICMLVCD